MRVVAVGAGHPQERHRRVDALGYGGRRLPGVRRAHHVAGPLPQVRDAEQGPAGDRPRAEVAVVEVLQREGHERVVVVVVEVAERPPDEVLVGHLGPEVAQLVLLAPCAPAGATWRWRAGRTRRRPAEAVALGQRAGECLVGPLGTVDPGRERQVGVGRVTGGPADGVEYSVDHEPPHPVGEQGGVDGAQVAAVRDAVVVQRTPRPPPGGSGPCPARCRRSTCG